MYQIFFYPTLTLPDVLGRKLDFLVSPLSKGGLRGVIIQLKSQPITFQTTSDFAKELTEELRNRPEVKVCFGVDENISGHELINEIFIDLLTKTYNKISEKHQSNLIIQPNKIKEINIYKSSEFIESFKYCGNNEYDVVYTYD